MSSTIAINFKESIEIELLKWSHWSRQIKSHLGYPPESTIAKMMEGTLCFNKDIGCAFLREDDNPCAEKVDKLISKLSRHHQIIGKVIKAEYIEYGCQQSKAKKLHISNEKFKMYLNAGITWLATNWSDK